MSDGGVQQVFVFVDGVGVEYWVDEVVDEFFVQVVDVDFFDVYCVGFGVSWFDFFVLVEVGGEGYYFVVIGIL